MKRFYRQFSDIVMSTLILLVVLNLLLAAVFFVRDRFFSPVGPDVDSRIGTYRERFADMAAYVRLTPEEVTRLLDEQDQALSLGFGYAPWVQFRHIEFRGKLFNTDTSGYRRTRPPAAPGPHAATMKINVFGGSTAFGLGVPDDHTIPSYLQATLDATSPAASFLVRNFGQGYYYSSQEMTLFLSLLKAGDVPQTAVFIDGTNDVYLLALQQDEPFFTPRVTHLWTAARDATPLEGLRLPSSIPMVRLAKVLTGRIYGGTKEQDAERSYRELADDSALTESERKAIVDYVTSRYEANRRLIRAACREYAVQCLFVWQPHPAYRYDRSLHRTFPYKGASPEYIRQIFEHMSKDQSPDFLFLGDLLADMHEKVFVDDVHYNEPMNERIARRIVEKLQSGTP